MNKQKGFIQIDPQTGVEFKVTRQQFYKQTYHPSKRYQSSSTHWPKEGETMTQFVNKAKQTQARNFIELNQTKYQSLLIQKLSRATSQTVQSATEKSINFGQGQKPTTIDRDYIQKSNKLSSNTRNNVKFVTLDNSKPTFEQRFETYMTRITTSQSPTTTIVQKASEPNNQQHKRLFSAADTTINPRENNNFHQKVTFIQRPISPSKMITDYDSSKFQIKSNKIPDEYYKQVQQIKQKLSHKHFMQMSGEPKLEYTKSHRLKKGQFKIFLQQRYGQQIAEKWVNLLDFSNPLDFQDFSTKLINEIFLKPQVMLQLAFDFYDCNNDEKVSEFDIFKILHYFGRSQIYSEFIQQDILLMLRLLAYEKQTSEKDRKSAILRFQHFRHLITKDSSNFILAKQKVMQPILNLQSGDPLKVTRKKKGNWFTNIIKHDSTLPIELTDQDQQVDAFEEQDSDSDHGYFQGSVYHEQFRQLQREKVNQLSQTTHQQNQDSEFYMKNRPAMKLATLTSKPKQEMLKHLSLPLTGSGTLDTYLNQYCEVTKEGESVGIEFSLFRKICFTAGVPMIIVDLLSYLTGDKSKQKCMKALTLLYERVQPIAHTQETIQSNVFQTKKNTDGMNNMALAMQLFIKQRGVHRMKKLIPPLKDVPDEVWADSGDDSDQRQNKRELEQNIRQVVMDLGMPNFKLFQKSFMKVGIHDPVKARKLRLKNTKLSLDEHEEPKIIDIYMTEKSMVEGFESLIGTRCDVFAKLLYIKASKNLDHCKLTIVDFYNIFSPLKVSILKFKIVEQHDITEKRYAGVFALLDPQNKGELNILTLLQMFAQLQDRTVFKYELLQQVLLCHLTYRILRAYKRNNVLQKDGFSARIGLTPSGYKKMIPYPSLLKAFQHAVFGYTLPRSVSNSHFNAPLNPFKQHTPEEFREIIQSIEKEANMMRHPTNDQDMSKKTDFMLTDQQYKDLFKEGFAAEATYTILKLI